MWKQYGVIVVICCATCAIANGTNALAADWILFNDFDETFIVYVRSASLRRYPFKPHEIAPGESKKIELGTDLHDLQVKPNGGGLVILQPVELINRQQTNLSEVVSPQGRKNGRTLYKAMQNDGYEIDDAYLDTINGLRGSSWRSSFANPQGGNFDNVSLKLTGSTGNYKSNEISGKLTNVMYTPDTDAEEVIIDGSWESNRGFKGRFVFRVQLKDPDNFSGERNFSDTENVWHPWSAVRQQRGPQ
jgi:hypothetical protein